MCVHSVRFWLVLATCLLCFPVDASPQIQAIQHDHNALGVFSLDTDTQETLSGRARYLQLIYAGDLDGARIEVLQMYPAASQDKQYLVEVGLIHSFLGDHESARRYCSEAYVLDSESSLILSCLGLASIYLPGSAENAIKILRKSVQNYHLEEAHIQRFSAETGGSVITEETRLAAGVLTSPVFVSTLASLEFNLLSALSVHQQHRQCIDWFIERHKLPMFQAGAVYILSFTLVQWSDASRADIDSLEARLRIEGLFDVPPSVTLWDEIRRVQLATMDSLSTAQRSITALRGEEQYAPALNAVLMDFMHVIQQQQRAADAPVADTEVKAMGLAGLETRGVALIQQYFSPDDERDQDINVALWRNLQNDYITDIYLLNEVELKFHGFPNAHKIHQIVIGERLTFQRAFAFANEHLQGRTVALDIFFDASLFRLSGADDRRVPPLRETRTVLALLKWRLNTEDESLSIELRTDSQDAWVFQPLVSAAALAELDFYMGLPRCDNRLVYVLQQHNYTVLGPAFAVHAIELDTTQRTMPIYNTLKCVTGPTSTLLLSDEFAF